MHYGTPGVDWRTQAPTIEDYRRTLATMDEHALDGRGQCISCKYTGPCPQRERAMEMCFHYLWLPIRKPGATNPELVNATRIV